MAENNSIEKIALELVNLLQNTGNKSDSLSELQRFKTQEEGKSLFDQIKDFLTQSLPGTKEIEEKEEIETPTESQSIPDQPTVFSSTEDTWEVMAKRQEDEFESMLRRQEKERDEIKHRHEQEREAMKGKSELSREEDHREREREREKDHFEREREKEERKAEKEKEKEEHKAEKERGKGNQGRGRG